MNQQLRRVRVSPSVLVLAIVALGWAPAAAQAQASCRALGGNRYHCASTGNPDADGRALYDFLNARNFPCGSTIILDAGASYNTPNLYGDYSYGFRWRPQTGCGSRNTEIISSRLGDLPAGQRITWADRDKMPRLAATQPRAAYGGLVISIMGTGVNNWALRGVILTTSGSGVATGNNGYAVLVNHDWDATDSTPLSHYPRNIEFDRCAFYPFEEERYGPMEQAQDQEAFWRGFHIALNVYGTNISIRDSLFKGIGGYENYSASPAVSASSATAASPAVVTAAGIASAFGLASHSSCATGCTGNCIAYGGCKIGVFEGATGNWAPLNGAKAVVYQSPNSVRVYAGDSYHANDPTAFDSTGLGALTGAVSIRRGSYTNPVYAILVGAAVNLKIENNFLESWGMNVFTGGVNRMPTDYSATVMPGSTASQIILSGVPGLRAGDLISVAAAGRSAYCTNSSWNCWNSGRRVGKVTSVSGTSVSVMPWGPDGIDVTPTTGGTARWNGRQVEDTLIRRNTLFRSRHHSMSGKGYLEIKSCLRCLFNGNVLTDSADGNWFMTSRNQAGLDPWSVGNITFSNNLVGGPAGAPPRLTLLGEDNERSSAQTQNAWFINNLLPGIRLPNPATANPAHQFSIMDYGNGINGGGWLHNTAIVLPGSGPHKAYFSGDNCLHGYPHPYLTGYNIRLADNILSYGESLTTNACLPGLAPAGNLFWASGSVNAAAIRSAWAGNEAVASLSAELLGNCDFANWTNCGLKPDSPYRGSASDGGDPGADIDQLRDHLNGWSEQAGLIDEWNRNRAQAIKPAGTKAVLDFRLIRGGACTVELYTNRNRSALHGDTAASGDKACGRSGNLVEPGRVVFVLGNVAALAPATEYFYKITQGQAVMVGSFRTTGDAARTVAVQVSDAAAHNLVVEYGTSPDFSGAATAGPVSFAAGSATVTFSAGGGAAVYWRWRKRDAGGSALSTGRTEVVPGA